MTLSQLRQKLSESYSRDTSLESLGKDDYATQRASIEIYNLIDAENVRARSIAVQLIGPTMLITQRLLQRRCSYKDYQRLHLSKYSY